MEYLNCQKIETAISRAKQNLIKKADVTGFYENFGRTEVIEIQDKFIDLSLYSLDENRKRGLLNQFENWCMTYTG